MIIEIQNNDVQSRNYTNKQTGEVKTYFTQIGWIQLEEVGYPEKIRFRLKTDSGYPVGHYEVLPASFFIGQYNELKVGYLQLKVINKK